MAALQIANPLGLTLVLSFAATRVGLQPGNRSLISGGRRRVADNARAGRRSGEFSGRARQRLYSLYLCDYLPHLWGAAVGAAMVVGANPDNNQFLPVLFDYRNLGWENAQMFAGMAVGAAILWLINTVMWPQPVAVVLKDSLRNTLERSRRRLKLLIAIFLGDDEAVPDEDRPVASKLGYHLTLLKSATQDLRTIGERAESIAAVMVAERIHNEIERLCEPACRQYGVALEEATKRDLREVAASLDTILEGYINDGRDNITGNPRGDGQNGRRTGCKRRDPRPHRDCGRTDEDS